MRMSKWILKKRDVNAHKPKHHPSRRSTQYLSFTKSHGKQTLQLSHQPPHGKSLYVTPSIGIVTTIFLHHKWRFLIKLEYHSFLKKKKPPYFLEWILVFVGTFACTGVVACVDDYMNIAMGQTEESMQTCKLKKKYGDAMYGREGVPWFRSIWSCL